MIYYALAYPHLQYCISSWGGAARSHINTLLRKQKRLIRVMLGQPFDAPSKPLFRQLNLLNIDEVYRYQVGKLMYDNKNQYINMSVELQLVENTHSYHTRSRTNQNYTFPYTRTNIGQNSLQFVGPKIWNDIPLEIKNSSKFVFKKKYKGYILGL